MTQFALLKIDTNEDRLGAEADLDPLRN